MAVREVLRPSVVFDWTQLEPAASARCTVGVAVPLAVGLMLRQPWIGAFGVIGAVSVGFGSFQGAYRSRAAVMIYASAGMAVAWFLGALSAANSGAAVLLAAVFAFGAGYFVALGAGASFVALQCGVAMMIAEGFPSSAHDAALRAGVIFGGGLAQTLLVVGVWPMRRFSAERRSTAPVYASLAAYARGIGEGHVTAPEPHTLAATMAPLDDPHPLGSAAHTLVFQALLDEAERIRASLAALAVRHQSLAEDHQRCAVDFAHAVGDVLGEIAQALTEAREPRDERRAWHAIEACRAILTSAPAIDALLGQLRAAWRTAAILSEPTRPKAPGPTTDRAISEATDGPSLARYLPPISDGLMTLKANLSLDSSAFRHAIRLAAAVAIASVVYHVFHFSRGYWIPMTALIVLRPEFNETFARGIARIAGTLLGAGVATAVIHLLQPPTGVLAALLLLSVWGCYNLFRVNYALFSVCLTAYVVLVLRVSGIAELTAARARIAYTVEGGLLAILVYVIWPTWAGRTARASFASLLEAHGAYVDQLLSAYVDPGPLDLAPLTRLRADARLQRSNTEALIERMNAEPAARAAIARKGAIALLAALRRHALAALALHAGLESGQAHVVPGAKAFADDARVAFAQLADAVRSGVAPKALPPLRQRQAPIAQDPAIGVETDMMVDSINTMAEILNR
jgi:uncharacterized membrane protein YccC